MSFVSAYADWTVEANGGGFGPDAEMDNRNDEWNSVFYSLLASAITRMTPDEAASHVVRAAAVPEESFFDIVSELVPAIDRVHFNGFGLELDMAIDAAHFDCRSPDPNRRLEARARQVELSVEMRIGPAIAALFFNNYSSFGGGSCYLTAKGIDRIDPFLPQLVTLIEEGPVPFIGLLTMNLLEVSPRTGARCLLAVERADLVEAAADQHSAVG